MCVQPGHVRKCSQLYTCGMGFLGSRGMGYYAQKFMSELPQQDNPLGDRAGVPGIGGAGGTLGYARYILNKRKPAGQAVHDSGSWNPLLTPPDWFRSGTSPIHNYAYPDMNLRKRMPTPYYNGIVQGDQSGASLESMMANDPVLMALRAMGPQGNGGLNWQRGLALTPIQMAIAKLRAMGYQL